MHGQCLNHVKSQVDLKVHLKLQGQGLGPLLAMGQVGQVGQADQVGQVGQAGQAGQADQMGQVVHHKMWVQHQVQVPQLTWTQVHQIWV